ncbi:MAG: hypothetical protein IPF41_08295 [Flavobacteriales bacterium]|nr:hypothetical protein [Flavobacteriales bacterium]
MRGGFGQRIEALRQEPIDFSAPIEPELDFSEEDVEFANRPELIALLDRITGICSGLIEFRHGNAVRQGVPVAIKGCAQQRQRAPCSTHCCKRTAPS